MKKLAIAMASVFTVVAPVAHAAYDRYGNWYDENTYSAPVYSTPVYSEPVYSAPVYSEPVYTPSPRERQEFARVIESRPVYESSNRKEECWNPRAGHYEERRDTKDSNVNGTVAGALLGGVLGHQVDSGAGGTIGGALLGGLIGNRVDNSHNSNVQDDLDFSRCRVVAEGDRNLQGYDVRYVYRGEEYTTRMAQNPGGRLRIGEDINEDGTPLGTANSYSSGYR